MSDINCSACSDLKEYAPEFVQNGVTTRVSNSLKNNTGLNPSLSKLHTNCQDFEDINDCLIGKMGEQVESYEVCDWKDYMKKFVGNLYEFLKAINRSLCGIWTKLAKHDCQIDLLTNGVNFRITVDDADENGYVVPGVGVDIESRSEADPFASTVSLTYIAGGLLRASGGIVMHTTDWSGANLKDINGTKGKGNAVWGTKDAVTINGNELIYEFRVKKSAYGIRSVFGGIGHTTNGSHLLTVLQQFNEGTYAYGQHGACDLETGKPYAEGMSSGHLVPDGWIYIQVRAQYIGEAVKDGANLENNAPLTFGGIRFNTDDLC